MRPITAFAALCGFFLSSSSLVCAGSSAEAHSSFKPPQTFKNINLVRNTNLEKGYARETVNVVVENVDKAPQSTYYLSFPSDVFNKVGGLEVRDRKSSEKKPFDVDAVSVDLAR
jgi:oligosaccharyltransferase complex subunit alpha (ribophorin I)